MGIRTSLPALRPYRPGHSARPLHRNHVDFADIPVTPTASVPECAAVGHHPGLREPRGGGVMWRFVCPRCGFGTVYMTVALRVDNPISTFA